MTEQEIDGALREAISTLPERCRDALGGVGKGPAPVEGRIRIIGRGDHRDTDATERGSDVGPAVDIASVLARLSRAVDERGVEGLVQHGEGARTGGER